MPDRHRTLPASVPLTPSGLAGIGLTLAGREDLWRGVIDRSAGLDATDRTSWGTRVAAGVGWEAWLHTWAAEQVGDLHVHDTGAGAVAVVRGTLRESVPGRGDRLLTAGECVAFISGHIHRLVAGAEPAVSLHVVARPFSSRSPAIVNAVPDAVTGADPPRRAHVVPVRTCRARPTPTRVPDRAQPIPAARLGSHRLTPNLRSPR